jgi:hypothetical protein
VGIMEMAHQTLPSVSDLHELELVMERLKGEMSRMTVAMSGQSDIMTRLEAIVLRHDDHLRRS